MIFPVLLLEVIPQLRKQGILAHPPLPTTTPPAEHVVSNRERPPYLRFVLRYTKVWESGDNAAIACGGPTKTSQSVQFLPPAPSPRLSSSLSVFSNLPFIPLLTSSLTLADGFQYVAEEEACQKNKKQRCLIFLSSQFPHSQI